MRALSLIALLALPGLGFADTKSEAKARLQNIDQLIEDWDIAGAKKELAELEKLAPADVEPVHYYKGRIAFEEGRYEEAIKELEAAGISERPGGYLTLARDTWKIVKDHDKAESEHFIFYYPKGKDSVLAPYALEALESQRKALAEDLGWTPPGKVRVEIVNDAKELSKVSTLTKEQIKTTGTIAICKFNKLMVTSPKAVVRGYDWLDTLAHEYTHLVVSQKSHNTVPIWLHEGLAKFLETRWRGKGGLAMSPSQLALLGDRVKKDKLISFEKMHPSIALLPSAEDAATAFAEVFFAIDLIHKDQGNAGLQEVINELAAGKTDKQAVEAAVHKPFPQWEKSWLAHVRKQQFPKELIPLDPDEKKELKGEATAKKDEKKKPKEISFGDFAEVSEADARKFAHLGELMREKNRTAAAAEEYGKAQNLVGNKYESISNKYALALLELQRLDDAERVLLGSLTMHPGSAATNVHLGRIYLRRQDWPKALSAYSNALAEDPFDEEIHVALFRVHEAMGAKDLMERERKATMVLTGVPAESVPQLAKVVAGENLADVQLPKAEEKPAAATSKADAGATPAPLQEPREKTR